MKRGLSPLTSRWLLIVGVAWCQFHGAGGVSANGSPVLVDPEIRRAIDGGPARVLVELRVPPSSDAVSSSGSAIATAQHEVLSRLPRSHFSVLRQFETVPFLALEVDVEALRALENMGALVTRVVPDRPLAPTRP